VKRQPRSGGRIDIECPRRSFDHKGERSAYPARQLYFESTVVEGAESDPRENSERSKDRTSKRALAGRPFVHNDYSFKSAPRRVRDHLPEKADRLFANCFAEINVWRAIRGPIESSPLALCDARSLGAEDIVPIDLVYRERVGEILGFLCNAKHRWHYFPRMQRNERSC